MRVAVVWNAAPRLTDLSVRFERYLRGFAAHGCEAFAVCPRGSEAGFALPVEPADPRSFADPDYWRSLRVDLAVVVTWLAMADVLAAVRRAGATAVSLADSDGLVGARVHPWPLLRRMTAGRPNVLLRLRAARSWSHLYLRPGNPRDRAVLESVRTADLTVLCSEPARDNLHRFLAHFGEAGLARKTVALPYPLDDCHLEGPVLSERADRVVAVGRWDDPQKDVGLLCRAAGRHLATGAGTEFVVVGRGGERALGRAAARSSRFRPMGVRAAEEVAELFRGSRSLLLTSRWESGPIVASEALASGCTVVGPDMVPFVHAIATGGDGTVFRGRGPASVATAIRDEMATWEAGQRDPVATAARWRPRLSPAAVCGQILEAVGQPCLS